MKRFLFGFIWLFVPVAATLAQDARNVPQAVQYIKLAGTLRELDKLSEAIDLLERALPAVRTNDVYWGAVAYEQLGLAYKDQKNPEKAAYYLEVARSRYAKLNFVASAWAVNELIRDVSGKNFYAGIQISPSEVKLGIYKTRYETDFYEKEIKLKVDVPSSPLLTDASTSFRNRQDALKVCFDTIRKYNIPNERVFIAFSSEMNQIPDSKKRLYDRLIDALPIGGLRIDTSITVNREAELFTTGAIPRKVWPTTSALAINDNYTVGGYFDSQPDPKSTGSAQKTFYGLSIPVGTNGLVSQIESRKTLTMDAFRREAPRVIAAIADSTVRPRLSRQQAGLQGRQTVGVGGDIALAVVTYLYPDKADLTAVPLSVEDIQRFKKLVMSDYGAISQPDLQAVKDPVARERAGRDLANVQSMLTEKQLIAGTLWLEALMQAYTTTTGPKRFVFVRNADIGWVTGKFLETISGEYEQTIAKGDYYTR